MPAETAQDLRGTRRLRHTKRESPRLRPREASAQGRNTMRKAIVFFSLTGKTRKYARQKAREGRMDVIEIKEEHSRGVIGAYLTGIAAARRQKESKLAKNNPAIPRCDIYLVAAPMWGGFPAPAFNSIISLLPKNSAVEVALVSRSGDSSGCRDKVNALISSKGLKPIDFYDIKADSIK